MNANKFVTSLAATSCVRRGIEALGGNGTIEDFSPLPRLYCDAIVFMTKRIVSPASFLPLRDGGLLDRLQS